MKRLNLLLICLALLSVNSVKAQKFIQDFYASPEPKCMACYGTEPYCILPYPEPSPLDRAIFNDIASLSAASVNLLSIGYGSYALGSGNYSKGLSIAGLTTGILQSGMGVYQLLKMNSNPWFYYGYGNERVKAYGNIGLGIMSTTLQTFILVKQVRDGKQRDYCIAPFSGSLNGSFTGGLQFVKRL